MQGRTAFEKGGKHKKLRKYFATFQNQLMCLLAQREIFRKTAVKSTIFELQQSFLHIFGVAQNFQFNDGGFMSQKGDPPSFRPCEATPFWLCEAARCGLNSEHITPD